MPGLLIKQSPCRSRKRTQKEMAKSDKTSPACLQASEGALPHAEPHEGSAIS